MGDITVELHSGMTPEEWDRAMAKLDEFGFAQKAAEKKGNWINHRNDEGHNIADCDQCGEAMQWFDGDLKPNYCPNCGSKMEESE